MKNHNYFLLINKNALVKPKSKVKIIFLGFLMLFTQNHIAALGYSRTLNNANLIAACPGSPIALSTQIICLDLNPTVGTLKATPAAGDTGATIKWYDAAVGGTLMVSTTPLEVGKTYYAASTNGIDCTRTPVVVQTNNALSFDPNQGDIVTLSATTFPVKVKEFTIEAWIKPDDSNYLNGYHAIFGAIQTGGNSTRNPSFYMFSGKINNVDYTGQIHIDSYDLSGNRFDILTNSTTPVIVKNVWSHIALVKVLDVASATGSTYYVYVNGVQVATRTAPLYASVPKAFSFGKIDNLYGGLIDEARFWNVPRSQKEIQDNMNIDLTGKEPGLVDYFTFNQGIANGDNTAISTLSDSAMATLPVVPSPVQQNNGTLNNFDLTGTDLSPLDGAVVSDFVGGYFAQTQGPAHATSSTIKVSDTVQLTHTTPGGVWSVLPAGISTIDQNGLVTGVIGGTAEVTYTFCNLTTTYPITVLPNNSPTISSIVNQSTCPGTSIAPLAFTIGDDTTPVNSLILTATSSNTALIPNGNIVLAGIGANRTVTLTTVSGQSGTATITISATDANGATTTRSFVASYVDATKPTVITNDIPVVLDASGNATITAAQINNGSTDNCSIATVTVSPTSFSCTNVGPNTVTLTVTDVNGNIQTGTATVTVTDSIKPTVITNNISVGLDASGVATITAAQINNGSTDNCSIATVMVSPTSFSCANVGANTVTLTVTDANGNFQTATATVNITDSTKPTVITNDILVVLDASGNASITAAQINNGSTDNCSIASVTVSPTSFSCANVGPNTVTLTVTDVNGNFQTGNAIVTVTETIKPTVITKNIPIELDASGVATITAAQINNGSTDNCAIATVTVSPSTFSCANFGVNTVTLTVTDASGNFQTGTATVTVTDSTKPTVITKNIPVVLDASGNASITAAQINNGSTDNCSIATVTASPTSFSCANVGPNTVTLTVTDVNGNVKTGTAIVTVKDATTPTVSAKNIEITLDNSGIKSINVSQLDNGSSDTCGNVTLTANKLDFNCNDVGLNTVILTATDGNGNTATATAIVTVISGGCGLDVSQAITPNGDGINDTWVISNIEGHPNTIVRVFNRWGEQVFYSANYKNDWDGHYKDFKNDLPSGGYYYQIDIDGNSTIDNQGWLYITK